MGFLNWLRATKDKIVVKMTRCRELGSFKAIFNSFGGDLFASDLVRDCVRPLAEHTSKANAKVTNDKTLERLINLRPNPYMNGKDFLSKVRTQLELKNTAFISIIRNDKGGVVGLYPIPYKSFEALEYNDRLFIRFTFEGQATKQLVFPWEDLAVLRKDYFKSDIAGEDNTAIIPMLNLVETSNQGLANAVKATANLRGILKSTKSMLDPEDVKKQKEQFVEDYLNLENEGGIASLDATQEFIPITMSPVITSYAQMKEFRENVFRYFGVNEAIITSNYTPDQMEAFYDARIEPFLVALGQELTYKIFTKRELGCGNEIVFEANRMQFCSLDKKIQLFSQVVLYGGMTINEWRAINNMAPVEGGDELIRRLDAAKVDEAPKEDKEEPKDEVLDNNSGV